MKDEKVFKSRGESGFGGFDKVDFLYTTKKVVLGCLTISANKKGYSLRAPKTKGEI